MLAHRRPQTEVPVAMRARIGHGARVQRAVLAQIGRGGKPLVTDLTPETIKGMLVT
jgi:hypothetical protein